MVSVAEAREAERISKAQRIRNGLMMRVNESLAGTPADMMTARRVYAAAQAQDQAFDAMLRDRDVNRLFNEGVLYLERPA